MPILIGHLYRVQVAILLLDLDEVILYVNDWQSCLFDVYFGLQYFMTPFLVL